MGINYLTRIDNLAPNGFVRGPLNTPVNSPAGTTKYDSSQDVTITGGPIDIALIAGGGGGIGESGGGAGGLVLQPARPISAGDYALVIGAASPVIGNDSTFDGLTAKGGGRSYGSHSYEPAAGDPGGSAGGVGRGNATGVGGTGIQPAQPGDSGTYGHGNPSGGAAYQGGSGGGGAGGASSPAGPQGGSVGGDGKSIAPVFGAEPQPFYGPTGETYAGGGGGRGAAGGPGGGGPGPGTAGATNSGSGGSGAGAAGVAFIKTPEFIRTSGVWSLSVVYNAVVDGNWV